jgi:hypothetical protein
MPTESTLQALILGRHRADMRYQSILSSTRAITFFGTPHQGGSGVSAAKFLANLLHAVNIDARSDLIKELNPDSLSLFDLTGDFRQVVETLGIVIHTFFEGKKTQIGRYWPMRKKILVSREIKRSITYLLSPTSPPDDFPLDRQRTICHSRLHT